MYFEGVYYFDVYNLNYDGVTSIVRNFYLKKKMLGKTLCAIAKLLVSWYSTPTKSLLNCSIEMSCEQCSVIKEFYVDELSSGHG